MSTGCCGAPRRCCYWRSGVEPRENNHDRRREGFLLRQRLDQPAGGENWFACLKIEGLSLELSDKTH